MLRLSKNSPKTKKRVFGPSKLWAWFSLSIFSSSKIFHASKNSDKSTMECMNIFEQKFQAFFGKIKQPISIWLKFPLLTWSTHIVYLNVLLVTWKICKVQQKSKEKRQESSSKCFSSNLEFKPFSRVKLLSNFEFKNCSVFKFPSFKPAAARFQH